MLYVNNVNELSSALDNKNITKIILNFDAGDISINRLIDFDLSGHLAGKINYYTEERGNISLLNSGSAVTIEALMITASNATVNFGNGIEVIGDTILNNVALGTFNSKGNHNGKVMVKDPDGGSVNFTGATLRNGIEIEPESASTSTLVIRGDKPNGNSTVTVMGNKPNVMLEGQVQQVIIEAENTIFHLGETGDAEKITISDTAKGSTITASRDYEYELLFTEGQSVQDIVNSNLFGDQQIRVVGYPSELENIEEAYLVKLDGDKFSHVYTLENTVLNENDEGVHLTENGKLFVDIEEKKIMFDGSVTGQELRDYLESGSQSLFDIATDWLGDGKVAMSVYDVKDNEIGLIQSDTIDNNKNVGMRVMVGTNEQHGLYILKIRNR